jgi:ribosome-associated protein
MTDSLDLARFMAHVLEDKKAENILLLDLRPEMVFADFFLICNGSSDRQLKALTDYVRDETKLQHKRGAYAIEGTPDSGWMLLDYGDIIVHIFLADVREYYNLEGLWRREGNVLLSIQ